MDHVLEGRSLLPLLHGVAGGEARTHAFCEHDYSMRPLADALGLDTRDARIFMMTDGQWKMIHFGGGFRPMLFDLESDPLELHDLGDSAAHAPVIARLKAALEDWALRPAQRTTVGNARLYAGRRSPNRKGVVLGAVTEDDAPAELTGRYRGRKAPPWRDVTRKGKPRGD